MEVTCETLLRTLEVGDVQEEVGELGVIQAVAP